MKQILFVVVLSSCAPAIIKKDPQCGTNVSTIQRQLATPSEPPRVKIAGDWATGGATGGLHYRITTANADVVVDVMQQLADDYGNAQWVSTERYRGKIDGATLVMKAEAGATLGKFDASDGTLRGAVYEDCQYVPLTLQRVQ